MEDRDNLDFVNRYIPAASQERKPDPDAKLNQERAEDATKKLDEIIDEVCNE